MSPACHPDHVVNLNFTASAHAQPTLDTGVKVHAHRNMTVIQQRNAPIFEFGEAALIYAVDLGHIPKMT